MQAALPQLLTQRVLDIAREAPDQMARISQLHLAIVNPQGDRRGRPSVDHDAVEPGKLELGGPETSGSGFVSKPTHR